MDLEQNGMKQSGWTIIVPMYRQPHLLLQCLAGIVHQSYFQHHVIVVYSDPETLEANNVSCTDWSVKRDGSAYRFTNDVDEAALAVMSWHTPHDVQFLDCSEALLKRGSLWDAAADGAWKSNYALPHVSTEWVMPSWDADYYPLPAWDLHMSKAMQMHADGVFVMRFATPDAPTVTVNADLPEYPAIYPGWGGYLSLEQCIALNVGDDQLHYASSWDDTSVGLNPQLWRTKHLQDGVPMPEPGKTPEWELSRKATQLGLSRIAHGRSWLLHKYSILGEAESVGA